MVRNTVNAGEDTFNQRKKVLQEFASIEAQRIELYENYQTGILIQYRPMILIQHMH